MKNDIFFYILIICLHQYCVQQNFIIITCVYRQTYSELFVIPLCKFCIAREICLFSISNAIYLGVLSVCCCSLCLLFQMAFHWFMLSINMQVFIETFSVVLYKFKVYDLRASGGKGGKGGKGDCSGQGKWLAWDCRPEY